MNDSMLKIKCVDWVQVHSILLHSLIDSVQMIAVISSKQSEPIQWQYDVYRMLCLVLFNHKIGGKYILLTFSQSRF